MLNQTITKTNNNAGIFILTTSKRLHKCRWTFQLKPERLLGLKTGPKTSSRYKRELNLTLFKKFLNYKLTAKLPSSECRWDSLAVALLFNEFSTFQ